MTDNKTEKPKQLRSILTRNKILTAAKDLFSEKGFHGTNSKEIAKSAGVATGTFYLYFKEKKLLFLEVFKQYYEQVMNEVLSLPATEIHSSKEGKAVVDLFIDRLFLAHDINPMFHREIISMIYSDEEVRQLNENLEKQVLEFVTQFLHKNRKSLRVKNYEAAGFLIHTACEELIHHLKIFGSGSSERDRQILDELKDMINRYLF